MNDWSLLVMKTYGVGVAIPTLSGLERHEACSASLLDEVPTASLYRDAGGCVWVLWKEPWVR